MKNREKLNAEGHSPCMTTHDKTPRKQQIDVASPCDTAGADQRRCETARHNALQNHDLGHSHNLKVVGSNPTPATILRWSFRWKRRMSRRSRSPADFSHLQLRLGTPTSRKQPLAQFFYVYVLQTTDGEHHYVGFTEDLRKRVDDHLSGRSSHTSKYGPWRLKTYVAFSDRDAAIAFEKYLKSGSGRAFAKKRL